MLKPKFTVPQAQAIVAAMTANLEAVNLAFQTAADEADAAAQEQAVEQSESEPEIETQKKGEF